MGNVLGMVGGLRGERGDPVVEASKPERGPVTNLLQPMEGVLVRGRRLKLKHVLHQLSSLRRGTPNLHVWGDVGNLVVLEVVNVPRNAFLLVIVAVTMPQPAKCLTPTPVLEDVELLLTDPIHANAMWGVRNLRTAAPIMPSFAQEHQIRLQLQRSLCQLDL